MNRDMIWDSCTSVTIDGDDYNVDYCAVGSHSYDDDPPENRYEVDQVDIQYVFDEEDNEVPYNKGLWNKIEKAVTEAIERGDEDGEYI